MNRHLFDPFLYRALRKVARGEIGSTSEKGAAAPQRGPVAAHGQHAVRCRTGTGWSSWTALAPTHGTGGSRPSWPGVPSACSKTGSSG